MKIRLIFTTFIPALALLVCSAAFAMEYHHGEEALEKTLYKKEFSPYVGRSYPTRVLWGDQHLHTQISVDAGTMCRLGQEDAYRFARGEEVTSTLASAPSFRGPWTGWLSRIMPKCTA